MFGTSLAIRWRICRDFGAIFFLSVELNFRDRKEICDGLWDGKLFGNLGGKFIGKNGALSTPIGENCPSL